MTIPVKIECTCGQHYEFDVESESDFPPGSVACPACGIDGTAAANAIIAQSLSAQTAVAAEPAGRPRIRITTPPPATQPVTLAAAPAPPARPRVGASGFEHPDRAQVECEARAKMLWGDSLDEVIKFMMIRGFGPEEASRMARAMFRERVATIRGTGIRKILTGTALAIGSTGIFLLFVMAGFISPWLLAATAMGVLYGLWLILTGTLKVVAPKSERGDASEND